MVIRWVVSVIASNFGNACEIEHRTPRRVIPSVSEESAPLPSIVGKVSLQAPTKLDFGDGPPRRIVLPFEAQVRPVRVFCKDQFEFLSPSSARLRLGKTLRSRPACQSCSVR